MTREQFRPPDHENDHFLLTTVVGSYPKPTWLHRARELYEDEHSEFDDEEFQEAKDDASRLITREHERAGVDVLVDGEMRRNEMTEYFAERISGYEFNGPVKVWGHNYFNKPSVVDEVGYDEEWLVSEYEFTADVASGPVKVPITGPYTLARCTADVPDDVRLGLHVCYGDYSRIYPEILQFPVDEFDVELCNGDYEQLDVFTEPPFTKDLGLGVVDAHDANVEPVQEIKRNIKRGLEVVPPERLTVSPDCGLKLLPREVAYEKMANLVTAAREVEAELDSGAVDIGAPQVTAD